MWFNVNVYWIIQPPNSSGTGEAWRTFSWVTPCLLVPNAWITSGFFFWEKTLGGCRRGGSCWRSEVCWTLASGSDLTGFLYGIGRRIGADSCWRSRLKKLFWTFASWFEGGFWLWKLPCGRVWWVGAVASCWRGILFE